MSDRGPAWNFPSVALDAFWRHLNCQPESGHCDIKCEACLTNALSAFLNFLQGRHPDDKTSPVPTIEATEPLCREMLQHVRHRVYVRGDGGRFIVRNGEWCQLHPEVLMTGADPSSQGVVIGSENRRLNGQWPVAHSAADCAAMLEVWKNPVVLGYVLP